MWATLGAAIPAGATGGGECHLHYSTFHALFTLPQLAALYFVARPFLTPLDAAKLLLLPAIAFVWTTPWDNEIVRNGAWSYPPRCVLARVGWVPVEEYAFFVIQSMMTTLGSILLTRWVLPTSMLPTLASRAEGKARRAHSRPLLGGGNALLPASFLAPFVALVPVAFLLSFARTQVLATLRQWSPGSDWRIEHLDHAYYLSMIVWWALIPIGLLWWGTRGSARRTLQTRAGWSTTWIAGLCLPTFYLWGADLFALRRGTWHITEAKSLNIFPIPELPIEEMVFFVATNTILTLANFAFERCLAIAYFCPELVWPDSEQNRRCEATHRLTASYLPLNRLSTYSALWRAFCVPSTTPAITSPDLATGLSLQLRDLDTALRVLKRASRSFSTAALLLPWDLRTDLSVVYAWCRAGDDLVDEEEDEEKGLAATGRAAHASARAAKERKLALLHDLAQLVHGKEASAKPAMQIRADVAARIECFREEHQRAAATLSRKTSEAAGTQSPSSNDALDELAACTNSSIPLRGVVPLRLWQELLHGYEMDLGLRGSGDGATDDNGGNEGPLPAGLRMESNRQLVDYAQCVAGCVGEMCVRVVLHRCGVALPHDATTPLELDLIDDALAAAKRTNPVGGEAPGPRPPRRSLDLARREDVERLLRDARRMGVALQLVNIARDVVSDARTLRRCYLVFRPDSDLAWIGDALQAGSVGVSAQHNGGRDDDVASSGTAYDSDGSYTLVGGGRDAHHGGDVSRAAPRVVTPAVLKPHVLELLDVAASLFDGAFPSLEALPSTPARSGLRAACAVYFGISAKVRAQYAPIGGRSPASDRGAREGSVAEKEELASASERGQHSKTGREAERRVLEQRAKLGGWERLFSALAAVYLGRSL